MVAVLFAQRASKGTSFDVVQRLKIDTVCSTVLLSEASYHSDAFQLLL
jgi:hypothetical protein